MDVVDVVIDKDVVVDVDKLDNDVVYVVDVIVDVLVVFDVDKEDVESDVIFEEICFINFILKLSKPMYVDVLKKKKKIYLLLSACLILLAF